MLQTLVVENHFELMYFPPGKYNIWMIYDEYQDSKESFKYYKMKQWRVLCRCLGKLYLSTTSCLVQIYRTECVISAQKLEFSQKSIQ